MTKNWTKETLEAAELLASQLGDDAAADALGVTHETLRRYRRNYKERIKSGDIEPLSKRGSVADELARTLSTEELKNILRSTKKGYAPDYEHVEYLDVDGDSFRFLYITDTHFGSKYTSHALWNLAIEEAEKRDVDAIFHGGDVSEGMSNRAGHVYELDAIGYDAQKEMSREKLSMTSKTIYAIDGNHDRWFIKGNGALMVKDLSRELDNVVFLGHDQARLNVNGLDIMMHHGEDGATYAISYRLQKIVESLPADDHPDVLLVGHSHDQAHVDYMGIEVVSGGCVQLQTPFMRGKRLKAAPGFTFIEVVHEAGEIKRFIHEWVPYRRTGIR